MFNVLILATACNAAKQVLKAAPFVAKDILSTEPNAQHALQSALPASVKQYALVAQLDTRYLPLYPKEHA